MSCTLDSHSQTTLEFGTEASPASMWAKAPTPSSPHIPLLSHSVLRPNSLLRSFRLYSQVNLLGHFAYLVGFRFVFTHNQIADNVFHQFEGSLQLTNGRSW